jgi:YbgC/YbaW family acyl-CoA thioester hydrolase
MTSAATPAPPARSDFRFREPLRIRWAEVDMQKIVFNGHYLMYFDTATGGYWRAMAMPYHETMSLLGGDLYVRKATVEYLGSALRDDTCEVALRCERIGNSSILFRTALFRGDTLLVHGELLYVFADTTTQTSRPVPPMLRQALHEFEAGAPMLEVRLGTWEELGEQAGHLRKAVFVQEQGIPAELEWDAADATALHALAVNRFGMAVATGRLLQPEPGVAKIGRMAVTAALRGSGVGRAVLDALVSAAARQGARQVRLHAQADAEGFYRRAGFVAEGGRFEEAGIPHVAMVRTL